MRRALAAMAALILSVALTALSVPAHAASTAEVVTLPASVYLTDLPGSVDDRAAVTVTYQCTNDPSTPWNSWYLFGSITRADVEMTPLYFGTRYVTWVQGTCTGAPVTETLAFKPDPRGWEYPSRYLAGPADLKVGLFNANGAPEQGGPQVVTSAKTNLVLPAATAPSAPTNVTVTPSGTSAIVQWSAPTSNGGSAVSGYKVGRDGVDASGAGPWSTTVSATTTSLRFDKLKPGSTYRLSVQAVNAVGTGPATTVTVVMPAAATAPSAPTNVTVTPSGTSAIVQWFAPTSNGGSAVSGYKVGRDGVDASGAGPWSTTVSATTTSLRFDKLKPGSTYRLSVQAVNAVGTGPATTVTVVMPAAATAPRVQ
ncbi:hypothetical protein GCM10009616_29000 [Microlunatus lacustris]